MCIAKNKHFKVRLRFCRPATSACKTMKLIHTRNAIKLWFRVNENEISWRNKMGKERMRITKKKYHHVKEAKRAFTFVYSGVRFLCDSGEMEMIWTESFDIFLFFLSFPFFLSSSLVTTKTTSRIELESLYAAVFLCYSSNVWHQQ